MKHSESWYAAALPADLHRLRPSLSTNTSCDVCIIGAGLTGVCAAYHLSGHGKDVVVLDAKRVGWGASGRNGGQIHSGFRQDLKWFHDKLGPDRAADIHQVSRAALLHLDGLIADLNIPCDRRHGLITAFVGPADEEEELSALEFAAREFGEPEAAALSKAELEAALGTDRYHSGIREAQGGHLQPLTFVTSVAEAAEVLGARFYDGTEATALETQTGSALVRAGSVAVTAQHVLLCGNGYLNGIHRDYDSHILPINNFILATEPIGAGDTDGLLPGGEAVADNRFVVRYWRPTPDGRLLFGGGETFSSRFPSDIAAFVRKHMLDVYPTLARTRIDFAWGGTLGITPNRLPFVKRLSERVSVAAGYSGQGVVLAPFAGKILADALASDPKILDLFADLRVPRFPGGRHLRSHILFLAMSYFALADRLK